MSNKEEHNPFLSQDENPEWEKKLVSEAETLQLQPAVGSWMRVQELLSDRSVRRGQIFRLRTWKLAAAAASVILVVSVLWLNNPNESLNFATEVINEERLPYYNSYLVVAQDIDGYLPVEEGQVINGFKQPLMVEKTSDDSI